MSASTSVPFSRRSFAVVSAKVRVTVIIGDSSPPGVGMVIGQIIYMFALRTLPPDRVGRLKSSTEVKKPLTGSDWKAVTALVLLCIPTSLFWAVYEQQGNTISLWAQDFTDRRLIPGFIDWQIPVTWFQAFNPFMIFAFTPACRHVLDSAIQAQTRALHGHQNGFGQLSARAVVSCDGGGGLYDRPRSCELAVAVWIFCRHHTRRTLSFAHRLGACRACRAATNSVRNDGVCGSSPASWETSYRDISAPISAFWTNRISSFCARQSAERLQLSHGCSSARCARFWKRGLLRHRWWRSPKPIRTSNLNRTTRTHKPLWQMRSLRRPTPSRFMPDA